MKTSGAALCRRLLQSAVVALGANLFVLSRLLAVHAVRPSAAQWAVAAVLCAAGLVWIAVRPVRSERPTKRLRILDAGCALLRVFLLSTAATVAVQAAGLLFLQPKLAAVQTNTPGATILYWFCNFATVIFCEAVVFWAGMLRVYVVSVQLGIRRRVGALLCAWVPGVNVYYLLRLVRIAEAEMELETEKLFLDSARAENGTCATRYPILFVHGVFFRDFRYLNYWGRIPAALQKNGAAIFYGEQQSAASVEDCGAELARRIRALVREQGCEKVNVIAHSKGGLDARAAISHFGAAPYVASLTTINTPHRGCLFAEYLLSKLPQKVRNSIADTYNAALKKLGDDAPDFLAAVGDLTASACRARNESTPDMPGVLYESVMSRCKKASSGRFPLNVSYPLVRHFDGQNDGLVAVDSAKWGGRFTLVEPQGERGISHGDMIDLNRENIPGFDVREFYVSLAASLKERGY